MLGRPRTGRPSLEMFLVTCSCQPHLCSVVVGCNLVAGWQAQSTWGHWRCSYSSLEHNFVVTKFSPRFSARSHRESSRREPSTRMHVRLEASLVSVFSPFGQECLLQVCEAFHSGPVFVKEQPALTATGNTLLENRLVLVENQEVTELHHTCERCGQPSFQPHVRQPIRLATPISPLQKSMSDSFPSIPSSL